MTRTPEPPFAPPRPNLRYAASTMRAAVLAVLAAAAATPVSAADRLGTFGDWSAYKDAEDGRAVCYIGSAPKSMTGDYTSRGDAFVVVTLRPAEKPFGVVTVEAGYPYADGGEVSVVIDDKNRFSLFTHNRPGDGKGDAWANTDADDKALVEAMKAGNRMVIQGRSSRGTLTTDTYSLSGFTRALETMSRACGG